MSWDSETPAAILKHEFSEEFVAAMRRRMLVSYHKYGAVHANYPTRKHALTTMMSRVFKYLTTRNSEYLVDAANMLMIEFMCPSLDGVVFHGTDSDQSPGLALCDDRVTNYKPVVPNFHRHEGD